jgi:hypothetical protein
MKCGEIDQKCAHDAGYLSLYMDFLPLVDSFNEELVRVTIRKSDGKYRLNANICFSLP